MQKFNIEYVKEFCRELGLECISTKYIDIKSKLEFICPECGEVYKRNFNNIKYRKNTLCYDCSRQSGGRKNAFSYNSVKQFVEISSGSGCKLLSTEYVNTDSNLFFQCACGNKFTTTFYRFKNRRKRQCNECGLKIRKEKTLTPIHTIIKMVEDEDYRFIKNKTNGGDQKMLVQCPNKHSPYWVSVSKFKSGQRCPYCYRSLGEEAISQELDKYNVLYQHEFTFDDLVGTGGGSLRYDFALFNNGELIHLIEYDGKQHFEVAFGDKDLFERIVRHDEIKNRYAESNNIPLLRIPYTLYDEIPQIIKRLVNKYKI